MIDANAFNFDAMKEAVGADPFAQATNKYARDERFYVLGKDKDGKGVAIIRFLPDSEKGMIQMMYKINTTIIKNGKKRFVSEFSPSTIGQPDPFQEKWQELWNSGDKEAAKMYGRGIRYVANIKVIKDPQNPDNEGKIFLYEMSGKMKDKLQAALDPSDQDKALGAKPKEIFNPLRGNSFKLACSKGSNGQINYDASEVISDVTSIYESVEEALDDIKNNTYKLSDLIKPEAFMSYEELQKKMSWVNFANTNDTNDTLKADVQNAKVETVTDVKDSSETPKVTEVTETKTEVPEVTETKTEDQSLDSLLDGLV